jgi:hypothetical protein
MSTTTSYRLSGIALILGSVLTIIYYVSQAFINGPFPEALAGPIAVFGSLTGFIGSVLVLLGLPGVYTRQAKPAGILGLLGFLFVWYVILFQGVLITFTSVTIVPMLVTDPATRHILAAGPLASFDPFDYVSIVGQTVGILLLAIATLRARVFPRWIAWLLIATVVLNAASLVPFLPNALGNIFAQVGYLAIAGFGYALLRAAGRRESVEAVPANLKIEARA